MKYAKTRQSEERSGWNVDTMCMPCSIGSLRVLRVLDRIIAECGKPQRVRTDNGPEFTSRAYLAWSIAQKIDLVHNLPGKPVENAQDRPSPHDKETATFLSPPSPLFVDVAVRIRSGTLPSGDS